MDFIECKFFCFRILNHRWKILVFFTLVNGVFAISNETVTCEDMNSTLNMTLEGKTTYDTSGLCFCNLTVCNTSEVILIPLSNLKNDSLVYNQVKKTNFSSNESTACKLDPLLVIESMNLSIVQWDVPLDSWKGFPNESNSKVVLRCYGNEQPATTPETTRSDSTSPTNEMTTKSTSLFYDCLLYNENGELQYVIIIPAAVGVFLLLLEFVIILCCCCRTRCKKKEDAEENAFFRSDLGTSSSDSVRRYTTGRGDLYSMVDRTF